MIIVAGGDSITFGSELKDCSNGAPGSFSLSTYSALLASEHEYQCVAYPGIGNPDIFKKVLRRCMEVGRCGIIITWTWPYRTNELTADEYILELQDFFNERNYPYMFVCVDNCLRHSSEDPRIDWDKWFFFPAGHGADQTETPRGFYQWAVESKYPVGPDHHPLEDAHRAAYELMKEKFNELVTKHL